MKSIFIIPVLLIAVAGCQSAANEHSTKENSEKISMEIPELFQRTGALATAIEWMNTQEKVQELRMNVAKNPSDVKSRNQIATIYISEARVTGEHPYYYPAIEQILNGVLHLDPKNFDALVLKSSVKLSQHKFLEAKELAEKAQAINQNNAYIYGVLVDANVELGNYEEAIRNSDKMQSMKPSLESYARASYLREIFGDYKGAIEAMKLAVQAGLPGSEPQCWSRNTLADLYVKTGDLNKAEQQYRINLEMRPSYSFSLAGLAKLEQEKKNYARALQLLDSAASILPEFSFHEQMGDIYAIQGEQEKAMAKYKEVKEMLAEDEASGHILGLEYVRLFIKMNDLKAAEKYALEEYATRPKNIDVNNQLAWIAYKKADIQKSKQYMQVAKRTSNKDPELLERAAIIEKL